MFFLVGLFGHLFVARADRRLRDEESIVAALGASLLGGLDVPESSSPEPVKGFTGRIKVFFFGDRPWHVATLPPALDSPGLEIRYRRVLARLREHLPPGPGRVLVVVAEDDPSARVAAARLGAFAAEERLELSVWEVDPKRPTVPDEPVPGVVTVVTDGTRTGWELVGITEACADGGHEVLGVVVTHRTKPAVDEADAEPEPALAGAG